MNNYFDRNDTNVIDDPIIINEGEIAKNFIASVFSYMAIGLGLTGFVAWYFGYLGNNDFMFSMDGGTSGLGMIIRFAPLILVFVIGGMFHRMSSATMKLVFFGFAVLMGLSLSTIFMAYSAMSILTTFAATGGLFGIMAILGYTTSTDLTKMGTMLYMALIGLILVSIINYFFVDYSGTMHYIISFAGVVIFTGLTAYDVQKLKRIGAGIEYGYEGDKSKLAIMGALSLYLDFINLFLYLLRFLGNRD